MARIDPLVVRDYLVGLQGRITDTVESLDGQAKFLRDEWRKAPGEPLQGDGITKIMEGGAVFERAGCGFSHVRGPRLPPSATQHRPELAGAPFEAMGVSLVFHPLNPYVPTVHMNVRMISAGHPGQAPVAWFGGGMDLTPYYGFDEDCQHFHRVCRDTLQAFGDDKYPRFKQWCDEYFYNKHRSEPRGIGGIFFDDFAEGGADNGFALMRSVAMPSSMPTCPSCSAASAWRGASASANTSSTGAGAMSNSTWCGTAARTSACSRAGAPNRFCCRCHRWCAGLTSTSLRPARRRRN